MSNNKELFPKLKEITAAMTSKGEMFEISTTEIAGMPLKFWVNAPGSLRDLWLSTAVHADKDYLVFQDERWTYAEAHQQVAKIANWLVSNGIKQHDRVAIAMRNYPEWMLAYWATICIGAVPVGMNAWWVADELAFGLIDSNAKLLICDKERLERFCQIREELPKLAVVTVRVENPPSWTKDWGTMLDIEPNMPEVSIHPDDDACIFYTSGTTGTPKGAQLTHRGCSNQVFSALFTRVCQQTSQAILNDQPLPNPEEDAPPAGIVATPLFHVTANNSMAHGITASGGKLVHMYKWDAGEALRIIEQEGITTFTGVPTMCREIINHPSFAQYNTSTLSALAGGGAAVQTDIINKIEQQGDIMPAQGYGMTETSGMVCGSYGGYLTEKPNSAGVVSPILDIKCIDDDGNDLPAGETGEICIRGPQVIKGYLNRTKATVETISDGWLHTGDIGYLDQDNSLYLVDRAKDMVLRGGENVYCSEVEEAIHQMEGIAECCVFSVPDDRLGEEVGVAIFPSPSTPISAGAVRDLCQTKMAAYKVPRYIWILPTPLPRNASGKFVKSELQKSLLTSEAS
ncbi:class I adenylate-forming enzyme family protein [Maricurvus nonylphenolicus]|uniref:class I adenylate-forming enzyme family protein n=1 Tax=Maricurvus nonylphenolicus TaxID=1008307 RepID=UPI0036F2FD01